MPSDFTPARDAIRDRLTGCFELCFPTLDPADIPRATVDSVPEWDSVATLNLLTLVEQEFGITFSDDAVADLISYEAIESQLDAMLQVAG